MTDPTTPAMNAATHLFHLPELLELILLSLPTGTIHEEIASTRTILLNRTVTRTWHLLILTSPLLRQRLYLPSPHPCLSIAQTQRESPNQPETSPRPNPWTPNLLLQQRSWGSSYPFPTDPTSTTSPYRLEVSRSHYLRLPPSSTDWHAMLLTQPPLTAIWLTRCFYELGSGRAPFVTYLDYDSRKPKREQRFVRRCPRGVRLGDVVEAIGEVFERFQGARWILVESVEWDETGDEGEGGIEAEGERREGGYLGWKEASGYGD